MFNPENFTAPTNHTIAQWVITMLKDKGFKVLLHKHGTVIAKPSLNNVAILVPSCVDCPVAFSEYVGYEKLKEVKSALDAGDFSNFSPVKEGKLKYVELFKYLGVEAGVLPESADSDVTVRVRIVNGKPEYSLLARV